jgi:hypothetical protein
MCVCMVVVMGRWKGHKEGFKRGLTQCLASNESGLHSHSFSFPLVSLFLLMSSFDNVLFISSPGANALTNPGPSPSGPSGLYTLSETSSAMEV